MCPLLERARRPSLKMEPGRRARPAKVNPNEQGFAQFGVASANWLFIGILCPFTPSTHLTVFHRRLPPVQVQRLKWTYGIVGLSASSASSVGGCSLRRRSARSLRVAALRFDGAMANTASHASTACAGRWRRAAVAAKFSKHAISVSRACVFVLSTHAVHEYQLAGHACGACCRWTLSAHTDNRRDIGGRAHERDWSSTIPRSMHCRAGARGHAPSRLHTCTACTPPRATGVPPGLHPPCPRVACRFSEAWPRQGHSKNLRGDGASERRRRGQTAINPP
jgi:hypothetical protein